MKLSKSYLRFLLKDWAKTEDILKHLKADKGIEISDRAWRRYVNSYNHNFNDQETYIASSNKGYKFTAKRKEIKKSAIKDLKLGISLIKNAKEHLLELGEKDQLSLLKDENIDLEQTYLKIML